MIHSVSSLFASIDSRAPIDSHRFSEGKTLRTVFFGGNTQDVLSQKGSSQLTQSQALVGRAKRNQLKRFVTYAISSLALAVMPWMVYAPTLMEKMKEFTQAEVQADASQEEKQSLRERSKIVADPAPLESLDPADPRHFAVSTEEPVIIEGSGVNDSVRSSPAVVPAESLSQLQILLGLLVGGTSLLGIINGFAVAMILRDQHNKLWQKSVPSKALFHEALQLMAAYPELQCSLQIGIVENGLIWKHLDRFPERLIYCGKEPFDPDATMRSHGSQIAEMLMSVDPRVRVAVLPEEKARQSTYQQDQRNRFISVCETYAREHPILKDGDLPSLYTFLLEILNPTVEAFVSQIDEAIRLELPVVSISQAFTTVDLSNQVYQGLSRLEDEKDLLNSNIRLYPLNNNPTKPSLDSLRIRLRLVQDTIWYAQKLARFDVRLSKEMLQTLEPVLKPWHNALDRALAAQMPVVLCASNDADQGLFNQGFFGTLNLFAYGDHPALVTVGSVGLNHQVSEFSSCGTEYGKPWIAAYGSGEVTTLSQSVERVWLNKLNPLAKQLYLLQNANPAGTSFSTPQVALLCAMIKQAAPSLSVTEIKQILKNTAIPIEGQQPGSRHLQVGYGVMNPKRAVAQALLQNTLSVNG